MGGRRVAAAALGLTLAVASASAGCGLVGDDGAEAPTQVRGLRQPSDRGRGCGERADTDPDDVAADRTVARCGPNAPEPDPLPQTTTLRVGIRSATEDLAPVLLAQQLGAFEEENLAVELVDVDDPAELFGGLANGRLDAVAADLDAAFFDTVHAGAGSGARLVLGGAVAPHAGDLSVAQPGLWIRNDSVSGAERWRDLRNQRIAVDDGIGDTAIYPMAALLRQDDTEIDDLDLVWEDGSEAVQDLLGGEVAGAWLPEPHWRQVAGRSDVRLVTTLPSESLGGVVLAGRLVDPARDRAVGLAFVRAVIRTINTSLTGDYQDDRDVVAALAEATGQTREMIRSTEAWVFDWEVRRGTMHRLQHPMIEDGGVVFEEEVPESRLVDRTLYHDAVTADG